MSANLNVPYQRALRLISLTSISIILSSPAIGSPYLFSDIIDSAGGYSYIAGGDINNKESMVFTASFDDNARRGIFL